MIPTLLLTGWIAAVATWTPMTSFNLACTGSQTAYEDSTKIKQTLPWAETFSVDLTGGTFCSQGCAHRFPLSAVTAAGLDLENSQSQYGSSLRRFNASTGQIQTAIVTPASATEAFHLQQTGTCTLKPPGSGP